MPPPTPSPRSRAIAARNEEDLELAEAPKGEAIVWEYNSTGLTLRRHPLALLRWQLWKKGYLTAEQLAPMGAGVIVSAAGIVTLRQQPETAKGVIFVSLEDETGVIQVICWKSIKEGQRHELLRSRMLGVKGKWQRERSVRNLIAHRLEDLSPMLGCLGTASRDFQ